MKILLSPAKSLNTKDELPTTKSSQPAFLKEAESLNASLSKKSKKAIGKLMSISDTLAALNYERYQQFDTPFTSDNARPAMYMFDGDVYTGLDAYSIDRDKIDLIQDRLRILSGMYGILKPLDLMQPYRLEMGTQLKKGRANNLYEFWGDRLTDFLNAEMEEGELCINLASNEYFKAINVKKLNSPIVTPIFKDFKNGKLKVISFFAKKARGQMVRYIIDSKAESIEDLKGFDYDNYRFSPTESNLEKNELVFTR
ncbi:MAG: peroxide stress protein YaaA [Dokdonia sp.]|jgi:cytoplasmic iron level regulating protein YaaA (DUF328/UPF0246 family)